MGPVKESSLLQKLSIVRPCPDYANEVFALFQNLHIVREIQLGQKIEKLILLFSDT